MREKKRCVPTDSCPNGSQNPSEVPSSASSVQCGNDRLFLGACNADVLDTEVCIQHFMQDTALFRAALPNGRQCSIQPHFGSHKACQLFKEPQVRFFGLGAVPLVRAGQIKAVFSSSSRKCKLFLDVFTKLVAISHSGINQCFPAIRPVVEIFGQDFGLVKREPIGILDAAIKIDGFKAGRLCGLVSESKRLLRKGLALSSLAYRPQTISRMSRRAWRTLLFPAAFAPYSASTGTSCFFSSGEIRQSDRLLSVDAFKLIIAVSLMERWLVTEN